MSSDTPKLKKMVTFRLPVAIDVQDRIVHKNGDVNLSKENIGHHKRYFYDLFTTLIDARWRFLMTVFGINFVLSWMFYACLWYFMALLHGDIEYYKEWMKADNKEEFEEESGHTPCVRNLYSFMSAFLYSVETQNTVGYGFRHITIECAVAPIILTLQLLTGLLIQAITIGVIIAKLARPKKRAQNILFSRSAVICHRNGSPCLMIRIGDIQKSYIVQASVKARLIRRIYSKQGELLEFHQDNLPMSVDNCDNRLMLLWPTIVYHRIDSKSPFWEMSAHDLQKEHFEIIVMLEGGVESTGLQAQARTSYLPYEILWGHRFQSVLVPKKKIYNNEVDYDYFDNTFPVSIPLCAAKDLIKNVCIHNHLHGHCDVVELKDEENNKENQNNTRQPFDKKY